MGDSSTPVTSRPRPVCLAVMPSVKEGWGLSLLEAALHETPAVAFRFAGGPRDSVRDGETGLLVPFEAEGGGSPEPRDPVAFSGALADRQDGLRLDWPEERRWLHLRASGTEPILRIIAEGTTEREARELIDQAREALGGATRT